MQLFNNLKTLRHKFLGTDILQLFKTNIILLKDKSLQPLSEFIKYLNREFNFTLKSPRYFSLDFLNLISIPWGIILKSKWRVKYVTNTDWMDQHLEYSAPVCNFNRTLAATTQMYNIACGTHYTVCPIS